MYIISLPKLHAPTQSPVASPCRRRRGTLRRERPYQAATRWPTRYNLTRRRNMVSKLNPQDFHAYRLVLDPSDFALGDDEPDQNPTDLISRDVWEEITTSPGDVAIRTSSHQGTRIAHLHSVADRQNPVLTIIRAVAEWLQTTRPLLRWT